jgi:hypothetical protein
MPRRHRNRNPAFMRNLRRAPARPALGNGRIQKALRCCFLALGPVVPADVLYSWPRRWERSLRAGRSEASSGRQILTGCQCGKCV